ncbi:SoxR reducing system RseC family protein [Cetobacterium ceti]
MKKNGMVKSLDNNYATLSIFKESACSHCSKCSESNKIANEIRIKNENNLEIGDIVTFEMEDGLILRAALLVYILPIILFFLGYFVGDFFKFSEVIKIFMSFLFLVLSFLGLYFYDRKIVKNTLEKEIHIISIEKHK